jgi:hypothetical protein
MHALQLRRVWPLLFVLLAGLVRAQETGVPVSYQLPTDGPLPRTYRVTLAIIDPQNPHWIVSTFAPGLVRTVTAENGGKFTERWNGLDENFMPVPPGTYAVKGIYMPAREWPLDGKVHTLTAKLHGGPFSWLPRPDQDTQPPKVHGDPVGSPPGDIATAPNGRAVFYWVYLENGTNNFLVDLNKPIGLDQVITGYGSGGAAGGAYTATDGDMIWSFCQDGGTPFVMRADGKPFGTGKAAYRTRIFIPDGLLTGLTAWRDAETKKSYVYVAERGKYTITPNPTRTAFMIYRESPTERLNRVRVLDGDTATVLGELAIDEPAALTARGGMLYALHPVDGAWAIERVALQAGLPAGAWQRVLTIRGVAHPTDFDVDSHGRVYVCDAAANQVYRLNADGTVAKTFGRSAAQRPGSYDPQTFISPRRLATWTDPDGHDRLIVLEYEGPGRIAEWTPDGTLIRTWQTLQADGNNGYAIDPQHPDAIYIKGIGDWLTRFTVDYATGAWTVNAVWPSITAGMKNGWAPHGIGYPRIAYYQGRRFLTFGRGYAVYRFDGDALRAATAIIRVPQKAGSLYYLWRDRDGDGAVQEAEYLDQPMTVPRGVFNYWGDNWQDDLSLIAIGSGTRDLWRLAPQGLDAHGNPIFGAWEKLLTDPVMAAKADGTADLIHGGNEYATVFDSAWRSVVGTPETGFFVDARGGNLSANFGVEQKISRYVPDGKGGYALRWRVGRCASIQGGTGSITGSIFVSPPAHGLVAVIDQTRAGAMIYTADEGLYVDTIMLDGSRARETIYGAPGEFFAGQTFLNAQNGKVYLAWGKNTPALYEIQGWTANAGITPLTTLSKTVTTNAAQVADPVEMALRVRGGAGKARAARFQPATGGAPALDGGMTGWEGCEPVVFGEGAHTVQVRCLYDPETIYLRWAVRKDTPVAVRPLHPADRLFTHDRGADTVGFYLQGDPTATGKTPGGRPGDLRVVFGLFDDKGTVRPAALGLYPSWNGPGASKITYGSPMGSVSYAHAALLADVPMGYQLDADKQGFILAAALPRRVLPAALPALTDNLRTLVNFDANFGGNKKLWWSNADGSANRETNDEPTEARLYPGSWAQASFVPLADTLTVRTWLVCGPWGGEELAPFAVTDKPNVGKVLAAAKYPPDDQQVDLKAVFTGPQTRVHKGGKEAGLQGPQRLGWRQRGTVGTDDVVWLDDYGRVFYAAQWVHVPEAMTVDVEVLTGKMNTATLWLNGEKLKEQKGVPVAPQAVTLKRGWNQFYYRGFAVGYDLRIGLVFHGTPAQLWKIKCAPLPPQ